MKKVTETRWQAILLFLTIALLFKSIAVNYRASQLSLENMLTKVTAAANTFFLVSNILIISVIFLCISALLANKKIKNFFDYGAVFLLIIGFIIAIFFEFMS